MMTLLSCAFSFFSIFYRFPFVRDSVSMRLSFFEAFFFVLDEFNVQLLDKG